ncbi:MAG TPA: hypothetical protein PKA06_07400 [Gemmatales bacterium]|nr:hypothetical protein [Gemmatales bacterium]
MLPYHLRNLAGIQGDIVLEVVQPCTLGVLLDSLEKSYPTLRGTIRDHGSLKRRPLVRFFACEEDISKEGYNFPLPEKVVRGQEPFFVVGAIAGG